MLAGSGPAASNFLLLRQKKVTKEKATRSLGPYASLRATCGARLRRGLAQTRLRLKQARSLIRLRLRSSAQPGRGNRERGQKTKKTNANKDTPWRVLVVFGIGIPSPTPCVCAEERRFRRIRDRDCLSEAQRSEFERDPAWTCLLYTSPSPRDGLLSRMPSSA